MMELSKDQMVGPEEHELYHENSKSSRADPGEKSLYRPWQSESYLNSYPNNSTGREVSDSSQCKAPRRVRCDWRPDSPWRNVMSEAIQWPFRNEEGLIWVFVRDCYSHPQNCEWTPLYYLPRRNIHLYVQFIINGIIMEERQSQ